MIMIWCLVLAWSLCVVTPALALKMSGGGGGGGSSSLVIQEIDGVPTGTPGVLKFSNGAVTNNGDGSFTVVTGAGGGGDFSSNTSTSVDSELVLFSGTGGKTGKRATGSGFARSTNGVYAAAELSGDATTLSSTVVTVNKVNGVAYPASPATDSVPVVTAANTATYKVIPNCLDTSGQHLNYDISTHNWVCGVSASANITGNAATATALAANGANCSAGQFPLGVDASGAAESCTPLPTSLTGTTNQIAVSAATGAITLSIPTNPVLPGTTTATIAGNASTATALATNGTNCSAGQAAQGVDASGNAEGCFTPAATGGTLTIQELDGTPTGSFSTLKVSNGTLTDNGDGSATVVTGGGSGVTDGDKTDITVSSSGTVWTIDNSAVTYAKLQSTAAGSVLLGRSSGTPGVLGEVTLGRGLTFSGSTLNSGSAFTFLASQQAGADNCAKIQAAIDLAVGAGGGVAVGDFTGAYTCTGGFTVRTGTTLFLMPSVITVGATVQVQDYARMIGQSTSANTGDTTIIKAKTNLNANVLLLQSVAGSGQWWHGGEVGWIRIDGNGVNQTTPASCVNMRNPGENSDFHSILITQCSSWALEISGTSSGSTAVRQVSIFSNKANGATFFNGITGSLSLDTFHLGDSIGPAITCKANSGGFNLILKGVFQIEGFGTAGNTAPDMVVFDGTSSICNLYGQTIGASGVVGGVNVFTRINGAGSTLPSINFFNVGTTNYTNLYQDQVTGYTIPAANVTKTNRVTEFHLNVEAALLGPAIALVPFVMPVANGNNHDVSMRCRVGAGQGPACTHAIITAPTAAFTITGMVSTLVGVGAVDGAMAILENQTAQIMTLANQNTGSTAGNRITTGTGADYAVKPGATAIMFYNAATTSWQLQRVVMNLATDASGILPVANGGTGNTTGLATGVANADYGDITVSGATTWTIDPGVVTYAKLQNVAAASKLLGSGSAGAGASPTEITLGTNLSMSGTTLNATAGAGGYATIQDEGSGLPAQSSLNFIGAGVTCVNNAGASRTDCTIPGAAAGDAAADGTTKGIATFTAADFNSATGVISLDYTNGQAASSSLKGFLTSIDWTTFNNKVSTSRAVNTTAPLSGGGDLSADRTLTCPTCTTNAAALTANQLIVGGGGQATAALGSSGTTAQVLHGNAAGAPTFGPVNLATDITGILPLVNGGHGLSPSGDDQVFISSSSTAGAWTTLPDCAPPGQALNYAIATNAWSCNAISVGAQGSSGQVQWNNAGAIAGTSGLTVSSTAMAGWEQRTTTLSTSATLTTADGPIIGCNATAGVVTATLPTLATAGLGHWRLVKTDSSGNACTLAANAADQMHGVAGGSKSALTQWSYVEVEQLSSTQWSATAGQTIMDVASGGTGATTLTGLVLGNGTSPMTGVTTSAGIAGAITDETGSGALVFGTSPTIVTPTIASFSNATHNHTNAAGGGQLTDAALSAAVTIAKGGTGTGSTLTGLVRGSASAMTAAELSGDVTTSGSNAATIATSAVTYAKMQNVSAASLLLGRGSAGGAGAPQEITLGTNLSMSGTTLNATGGGGAITSGTANGAVYATGTTTATSTGALTDGQVLMGSTGSAPTAKALSPISAKTTTYTATVADFAAYTTFTVASGTFTITLPINTGQPAAGTFIRVVNYGTGTVTIARNGQNLNGGTASLIIRPGSATNPKDARIFSDGTNYFATSEGGPNPVTVSQLTDAATVTPNADFDMNTLVTLSQATTINPPSGTFTDGQRFTLRIKSITARALTWSTATNGYRGGTMPCPATTTGTSLTDYMGFIYNGADSKWDCVSFASGY